METQVAWALLLAAGRSTRFGGDKLLARLSGRPLVSHVLAALGEARLRGDLAGVLAVVPPSSAELATILESAGCRVAVNQTPEHGLSSSLRLGLQALGDPALRPPPEAALVVMGDQPALTPHTIASLVRAWRAGGGPVLRARYLAQPKEPGHPVLISRDSWSLVDPLRGDVGLGPVFCAHPELVTAVDVPGQNPDIDTTADLTFLEERR